MCSQWLSYWRGMQRYGPSSWSVILQDPDFAGLAHRTFGQLKDRCRSVLQQLIRAGVNPNDMQPWILGTPLGSLDRGRIPAEQMQAVLAARERAYANPVNPNGYQGYSQWNNEMMRAVRADSDSESDRSASPVVYLSASLVSRLVYYVLPEQQNEFRQFDNISKVSPQRVIRNTRSLQSSLGVHIYDYEAGQWIAEDPGVVGMPDLIGKSNKGNVKKCYYNGSLVKYFPNLPVVFNCAIDKK
ncbi:hypothetical protein MP228_009385 [Amoeboaphelidium protococcarum]|nr:hypothetical protein MP228_009385 [Amoeboaphelidium protococcarum]